MVVASWGLFLLDLWSLRNMVINQLKTLRNHMLGFAGNTVHGVCMCARLCIFNFEGESLTKLAVHSALWHYKAEGEFASLYYDRTLAFVYHSC